MTDNGGGITKGDLQLVGKRYVTSKCHTLSDLNELCCYGYRGEALASLSSICRQVEIISRHRFSNLTNYKSIQHGQAFPPVLSPSHQLSRYILGWFTKQHLNVYIHWYGKTYTRKFTLKVFIKFNCVISQTDIYSLFIIFPNA